MKKAYQSPKIVDESSCEAQAIGCPKIPGIGDPSYCGPVWVNDTGNPAHSACIMNPETRSS